MLDVLNERDREEPGFLDGHFLIAMPAMSDSNFDRAVVYICAHSEQGAMGFIINKPQEFRFADILAHLDIIDANDALVLPDDVRGFPVLNGGPVDQGRGFVLHSDDYHSAGTIPVTEDICLTGTQDIIKAIAKGRSPRRAAFMLGYAGWAEGQLEHEVSQNAWLTCRASDSLIFDRDLDSKYSRAMAIMGINASHLSNEAGHA